MTIDLSLDSMDSLQLYVPTTLYPGRKCILDMSVSIRVKTNEMILIYRYGTQENRLN